jgi:hypothetical protein
MQHFKVTFLTTRRIGYTSTILLLKWRSWSCSINKYIEHQQTPVPNVISEALCPLRPTNEMKRLTRSLPFSVYDTVSVTKHRYIASNGRTFGEKYTVAQKSVNCLVLCTLKFVRNVFIAFWMYRKFSNWVPPNHNAALPLFKFISRFKSKHSNLYLKVF